MQVAAFHRRCSLPTGNDTHRHLWALAQRGPEHRGACGHGARARGPPVPWVPQGRDGTGPETLPEPVAPLHLRSAREAAFPDGKT